MTGTDSAGCRLGMREVRAAPFSFRARSAWATPTSPVSSDVSPATHSSSARWRWASFSVAWGVLVVLLSGRGGLRGAMPYGPYVIAGLLAVMVHGNTAYPFP